MGGCESFCSSAETNTMEINDSTHNQRQSFAKTEDNVSHTCFTLRGSSPP